MIAPDHLRYTRDHHWVSLSGNIATVGVTDYLQNELGTVEFVELPDPGDLEKGSPCGQIEASRGETSVFAPISGEVVEVNTDLVINPRLVNEDPYDRGWIYKLKVDSPEQYEQLPEVGGYLATLR